MYVFVRFFFLYAHYITYNKSTMKMTDLLDKDKSNLITELTNAAIPEKAVRVLENETDRLLLRFNEQSGSEAVRDTAAYLMQAVRLALPLIDSTGTTKVWETREVTEEVSVFIGQDHGSCSTSHRRRYRTLHLCDVSSHHGRNGGI